MTYPFSNFNGGAVEAWKWRSNFILHFIMNMITYPCRDLSCSMLAEEVPAVKSQFCQPPIFYDSMWDPHPEAYKLGFCLLPVDMHTRWHTVTSHATKYTVKSQNLSDYHLVLQLSLPSPFKPGVKSRMKMELEQRRQAMLQLHQSDIRGLTVKQRALHIRHNGTV